LTSESCDCDVRRSVCSNSRAPSRAEDDGPRAFAMRPTVRCFGDHRPCSATDRWEKMIMSSSKPLHNSLLWAALATQTRFRRRRISPRSSHAENVRQLIIFSEHHRTPSPLELIAIRRPIVRFCDPKQSAIRPAAGKSHVGKLPRMRRISGDLVYEVLSATVKSTPG
jgi:hypothetical protein